jgi:hypothetical protein
MSFLNNLEIERCETNHSFNRQLTGTDYHDSEYYLEEHFFHSLNIYNNFSKRPRPSNFQTLLLRHKFSTSNDLPKLSRWKSPIISMVDLFSS